MLANISESRVDSFRYYYLSELDNLNLLSSGEFLFSSIELAIESIQANKNQVLYVYTPYDIDKNKLYPNSTTVGRVFFKENIRIKKFGKIKINDNGFEWVYRNIINELSTYQINTGIKNIIFDLDGVLIKNKISLDNVLKKFKITEDELKKYLKVYYEIVYKNGSWSYNMALKQYMIAMTPYNTDYEFTKTLFDFIAGSKTLYDYTIPLVKNLKSRGYNLYYLSNWARSSYEICKMNGLFNFLDEYFEGGLFSFKENLSKPNYKFFNRLLNRYELSVNNCILIDDQEANISTANMIGIRSILFTKDIVNKLMDNDFIILGQSLYSKGDDSRLHSEKDKDVSVVNEAFDIGVDIEDDEIYDGKIYDPLKNTKKSSSEVEFELPDMESYKPDISTLFDNTPLDHIYLTSDWHFFKNHYKHEANYVNTQEILKWCKQNIKPEDVFVYLGDLSFRYANQEDQKKSQEFMSSIQGHKIFVLGNHDKMLGQEYFTKCGFDYVLEDFTWKNYIFTHKPVNMDTYPDDWWNIHGHIHNLRKYNTTDGKKNVNVYPMFFDNKPVTMQYIIDHKEELVKDNEWNFNTGYGESTIDTKLKLLKEAYNTKEKPVVYYSSQVDSKIIAYMVSLFQDRLGDRIALKLHFGETGNKNFLSPNLLKDLVKYTNAALVDSNTAYEGSTRGTTQDHIKTARDHGFDEIGFIDILDADGGIDISIPKKYMIEQELRALANGKPGYESCVTPGRHLSEINVGAHIKNYDSLIVYTHFKGHDVAGYGGAVKNIGMGIPTGAKGKMQIHGEDWARGPLFLERLVESASAIESMFDNRVVYINVLQNLSTMCDCDKDAPKSTIPNIGVLVSTDILAIEQASLDFIRNAPGNKDLMEQISKLGGTHQIEYMKWLGMGSSNYTLKDIEDDKTIKLEAAFTIYKDDFKAEKQLYLSNFNKIKIDAKYVKDHPEIADELKRNDIDYKSDIAYVWENKNNNIIAKLYIDNKDYKDGKKWIALIEITNGYRGAGLGKQVLEYAINVEKCTAVGVHKDNTVALNLYKQYGFKFYPKAEQDVKDGKNKYYLMYRGKLENPELQASGNSENVSEGYIFNKDDIYYNKEKFEKGLTNVCFITGQSGSGKSTMGKKYNNKAVVVELDDIIWNKQYNTIEDFRNRFGPLVANFFTDSKYKKYFLTVDELRESKDFKHVHYEDALINDFVDYTLKYATKHKDTKFVLEGVWIYLYIKPEQIKDYAVYIKGTSMVVSLYRACKRDGQPEFLDPGMWFEGESKLKKFRKYFVNRMLKDSTHESAILAETKRSELPDSAFGIPEDRKFPLDTAQHVKSAIHLFGHAQEDKKKRLARRIKAAAKKYNITIPETTQCYKYLSEGALISIIPDNVNTIVFDMGNVLVDANSIEALHQNPDIPDEYCDEIKDIIDKECFYSDDRTVQAMDIAEIKTKLNESVPEHIKPYIDSILETFIRAMFVYPYVYSMLAMLRSKGYKLYYLSNWTRFSYKLEESFFKPLLSKFDGGLFSFELGTIAKPDREMFEIFINKFNLDPSTCIFFDDRQENIDAAISSGFNAYRFDKNETPNIIFGQQIDIPDNADDNILIADGDNGFKSVPLDTITWWYICENRNASNVDEECFYKTLEDCIKFKLERLISTNAFTDSMLEIKEYVFTNSKAFSEIKTPPVLVPVGIINITESGAYEWEIQYPLRLENNILYSSFKENSLAAINPVIGLHKPFLIKIGDPMHPENLPSDHYVYTNDINNDKCLSVDNDGAIKLTKMDDFDVLEAYEFIGNPAYINRLNRYYAEGTKVYNLYTALTDKLMLTEDQIEFDPNFKKIEFNVIEQKVMAEMVTLRDNIMDCLGFKLFRAPFIESPITKNPKFVNKYKDIISIKEDFDGNYFENNITKKRSISVSSSTMLTEDMIKAIL